MLEHRFFNKLLKATSALTSMMRSDGICGHKELP
jgi:hypothetical protein